MASPTPLAVAVTTVMQASPATVYGLISDITRMSEFSPETFRTSWLDGATGPRVGARFKGSNAIGKLKWSTKPWVTEAEPGMLFAFKVPGKSGPQWRYELTPVDCGTQVTESMRQEVPSPAVIRLMQRRAGVTDRAEHLRSGMITTLDRLAAAAVAHDHAPTTAKA